MRETSEYCLEVDAVCATDRSQHEVFEIWHISPKEQLKQPFWARLIHHYCGRYRPTPVMKDLKAIVGVRDYFIVTSNGEQHFELCGFEPRKIYEIEGNWLTMPATSSQTTVLASPHSMSLIA